MAPKWVIFGDFGPFWAKWAKNQGSWSGPKMAIFGKMAILVDSFFKKMAGFGQFLERLVQNSTP